MTGHVLQGNLPISYKEITNCLDSVVRIESLVQVRVTARTGKLPQKSRSDVPAAPYPCQASGEPLGEPGTDGTGHRGRSTSVPALRAVAQWEMWKHKWLVSVQAPVP